MALFLVVLTLFLCFVWCCRIQDLGGEESVDRGASAWDSVVTCFFVDTAPVVLE